MLTVLYHLKARQSDLFQESSNQPKQQDFLYLVDRLNKERWGGDFRPGKPNKDAPGPPVAPVY